MEISREMGRQQVVLIAEGFRKVLWLVVRVPVQVLERTALLEILAASVTTMSKRHPTVA